jgi:hypothetical protein
VYEDGTIGFTDWWLNRNRPLLPGSDEPVRLTITLSDTPVLGGFGAFTVDSFLLIDNILFDDITLSAIHTNTRGAPDPPEETGPPPPSCGLLGIEALAVPLLVGALGDLRRRRRLRGRC